LGENSKYQKEETSNFLYNGQGDRIAQIEDGVQTPYLLDLNAGLTQVLNDGTRAYVYGLDLVSQQTGINEEYPLRDELGSVRQVTDQSSAITGYKSYEPYGEVLTSSGEEHTPYGFAGEWTDTSGMQYLRARYYEPRISQFIQSDPIIQNERYSQGLNRHSYVQSNPINRIDPSGMYSVEVIKKNLKGMDVSEVFGKESYTVARWGLYALLKDAKDYDQILPRSLDFSYTGAYPPLAPDLYGQGKWTVTSKCDQLFFKNDHWGEVSLLEFIDILNRRGEENVSNSDKWWRPATLEYHWYQNGNFDSDFYKGSYVPDLLIMGFSPEVLVGVGMFQIVDRYGNEYTGVGISGGYAGSLIEGWEGYATLNGSQPRWGYRPGPEALQNVIEGWDVGLTALIPTFGVGITGWRTGSIGLFGGLNVGIGVSLSGSYTWKTGNSITKRWRWVDDEIRVYGPQP
jgi:RHS repeat-associated protein